MAILISNKVDFRAQIITGDKKGHLYNDKGSIHQDIAILNIHVPNNKDVKSIKSKDHKTKSRNRQIHNSTWRLNIFL